jgi:hypothetical protein
MRFSKFSEELKKHSAAGYHRVTNRYAVDTAREWFAERGITASEEYLDFLQSFGAGRYFAGSLVMFPLDHDDKLSVASETGRMIEQNCGSHFAFGYNGTTEGCYCLSRSGAPEVSFLTWGTKTLQTSDQSFVSWVEMQPEEWFKEETYKGYKPIKDLAAVHRIEEQRRAFRIRLLKFAKDLVRPPGNEKDFLPRYNRVLLSVLKTREVPLQNLTVTIRRTGSRVGKDNRQSLTIAVGRTKVGVESQIEGFAFDPFNLPFEGIEVEFSPEINLGTPMRTRFVEIRDFL